MVATFFTTAYVVAGAHARPTAQVLFIGELTHVCAYFADDIHRTVMANAWNCLQQLDLHPILCSRFINLFVQLFDQLLLV